MKIVSLELNELNFDFVKRYCALGRLPTFARLLNDYQEFETLSDLAYPELEPWIQWPTVYTGLDYPDHGIFRLGDVDSKAHVQVWEVLEQAGVRVGAISPMNAANRCRNPAFFMPDPWTVTRISGGAALTKLYAIVRRLVNENAHEKSSMAQIGAQLLPFVLRYAALQSVPNYARILRHAVRHKWARAVFLDRFLADLFLKLRRSGDVQFGSLFLNAGAHIQHHHMFDSKVYDGPNTNPVWYSGLTDDRLDPLLFCYEAYDGILRDMLALPDTRVLVTTAISQYPNARYVYQYRFKDHASALRKLGIGGFEVTPRMSRDFLLSFADAAAATLAAQRLGEARCAGEPLFTVEDRGTTLFCQLAYFGEMPALAQVSIAGKAFDLAQDVALVSVENGLHRSQGYHFDTAVAVAATDSQAISMPLRSIFAKILEAFPGTPPVAAPPSHATIAPPVARVASTA